MSMQIGGLGSPLSGTRIAYINALATAVGSSAVVSSGYPVANMQNWFPHDKYRGVGSATTDVVFDLGAATFIDALGLHKHNLGTVSGTLTVAYATTSAGGTYTDLFAITPGAVNSGGNRTLFRVHSAGATAQWWRFRFTNQSTAVSVGVAYLGAAIELPAPRIGFAPATISRADDVVNNRSEGGEFLGRSLISRGFSMEYEAKAMSEAWLRGVWSPLLDAVMDNPFFFAWDKARYPDEAYFCFLDRAPKAGKSVAPAHHEVSLSFIAR